MDHSDVALCQGGASRHFLSFLVSHRILFLWVGNSVRSPMTEGFARSLVRGDVEVLSAGSQPSALHPMLAEVLDEKGIATAGHYSKGLGQVPLETVQTVITLCEEEVCPVLPEGTLHMHWPMADPALAQGDELMQRDTFRSVRDEIGGHLQEWLGEQDLLALV
jgi:arsenate reductase